MVTARKSLTLILAGMLTAVVLSGPPAMAETRVRLVCDAWPPYQVQTDDGADGMAVEIVKAVYQRLGYTEFDIQVFPWKRAMDAVRFAEADALFSAGHTPERSLYLCYPDEPLFESAWIIWTRTGSPIQTMDDLKDKKVGVVLGYSYTEEFWDFIQTYCTVEEVHSDEINFKKLSLGRLDAIAAELGNGEHIARALGDESVRPVPGMQIKKDGLYIVFNRGAHCKSFVKRFSEELKAFKQTEEHRMIRKKYLGTE